jgi:hypothetical protein
MNSHWVLLFFVWILPHLLLGVLAVFLCRRGLYREFPCFFVYVCYEIAEFCLLFSLRYIHSVTNEQYRYAYYATLALSVVLRFGVIEEIFRDLLREARVVQLTMRRSLRFAQGLLLIAGCLLAIYAPGDNSVSFVAGMSVVNRGLAMVQSGFLLFLIFLCSILGLSWRRPVFGIALGLGVIASVDLGVFAVRAAFSSNAWVTHLDLITTVTYLVCVSIWIGYVVAPEPSSAALMTMSDEELKVWNKEFQHLLRP